MKSLSLLLASAHLGFLAPLVHADTFGSRANKCLIDFVGVGNAGNNNALGEGEGIYSTLYLGIAASDWIGFQAASLEKQPQSEAQLGIHVADSSVVAEWFGAWTLQSTTNLEPPILWTRLTNGTASQTNHWAEEMVAPPACKFYSLTTNKLSILNVQLGIPTCSSTGSGSLDGPTFAAGAAYLYVVPTCTTSNSTMYVWIRVESTLDDFQIDHYIWTIRDWTGSAPDGVFTADTFDTVIDTNGVFEVQSSTNEIRYSTATIGDLFALQSLFNQAIEVKVVSKHGQIASGCISLKLHNGMSTGDGLVFGNLSSLDNPSMARSGAYADYFSIIGKGSTNRLRLEGDFDTFLVLYDTNGNGIATNDDIIPGLVLDSQISTFLTNGATYIVEATSFGSGLPGNYSISNNTGPLTPVPSPFVLPGSCTNVATTYSVAEESAISFSFNGQSCALTNFTSSIVTVAQDGCDFWYQFNDPTGLIPPGLRMGRITSSGTNSIQLYNDAYIPQCSEIFVSASSISGSGSTSTNGMQIDSYGSIQGTFLGLWPFAITYTSSAAFSK